MPMNQQILLYSRPDGVARAENFRLVETALPQPAEGQVLLRHLWLSLDPYMRMRMDDVKSYAPSAVVGEVMMGAVVAEVLESRNPKFKAGDTVLARQGWQLYSVSDGRDLSVIDPSIAPLPWYLGILGSGGATAWVGLFDIGAAKAGETVVVSAASGSVGSVVGQLAKLHGCRVVGIAGGPEKCGYCVDELNFDACIDYKAGNLLADLQAATPKGVDVYFDNVGGEILDAVLTRMNPHSRLPLCGTISQYDKAEHYGIRNFRSFLVNRIRLQGFVISDYRDEARNALPKIIQAVKEGKLKYRLSVAEGLAAAPEAFLGMLKGRNFGKQVVKLA